MGDRYEVADGDPADRSVAPADSSVRVAVMAVSMVAFLATGWAFSGHLVQSVDPLVVAAVRTLSVCAVLSAVSGALPRQRHHLRRVAGRPVAVLLLAVLGFLLYYGLTMSAVSLMGASATVIVVSLLPCITLIVGRLRFGEALTAARGLGCTVASACAVGYVVASSGTGGVVEGSLLAGSIALLLALGGTVAYATYGYCYRRNMSDVPPVAALPAVTLAAGAMLLGVATPSLVSGPPAMTDLLGVVALGAVFTVPVFALAHRLVLARGPVFTNSAAVLVPFLTRILEWAFGVAPPPGYVEIVLLIACGGAVVLVVTAPEKRFPR